MVHALRPCFHRELVPDVGSQQESIDDFLEIVGVLERKTQLFGLDGADSLQHIGVVDGGPGLAHQISAKVDFIFSGDEAKADEFSRLRSAPPHEIPDRNCEGFLDIFDWPEIRGF